MKTYILQKNQYGRDKWLYTIVDNKNNIVAKRVSKRDYVAATIDGHFFFGRRDLVGYGDHGSRKWAVKNGYNPDEYVSRLKERMGSPEEWVEKRHAAGRELLDRMQVAYLPE